MLLFFCKMEISKSKSEVKFMAIKSVSIRIEEKMLDELGFVATYEGRSVNSHILVLIRENIKNFETQNGQIICEKIPPEETVKPTRKRKN